MRIDAITIFPEMIADAVGYSVVKRAQENGLLQIVVHDLRDFAHNQQGNVWVGYWRVGTDDLTLLVNSWQVLEPDDPPFPSGPGIPPDCGGTLEPW